MTTAVPKHTGMNEQEFEELFRKYRQLVYRAAYTVTGRRQDAQDDRSGRPGPGQAIFRNHGIRERKARLGGRRDPLDGPAGSFRIRIRQEVLPARLLPTWLFKGSEIQNRRIV